MPLYSVKYVLIGKLTIPFLYAAQLSTRLKLMRFSRVLFIYFFISVRLPSRKYTPLTTFHNSTVPASPAMWFLHMPR